MASRVPFNDLRRIHEELRPRLDAAFDRVLGHHEFILGREVREFEREFSRTAGVSETIGCASGTDALILGLLALGIGPGDEVVTTPFTFIAGIEAIIAVGARPVLADVGADAQLDARAFERAITPRTRAVMPVHLYGHAAPMEEITRIADERKITVIEDAAQAHGALLKGRPLGSWGRLSCFSFFPGKNLGALGDAGAVCTSDEALAAEIRSIRDHGRTTKYTFRRFGRNMRMDGMQAAFLREKLPLLEKWNARRGEVARLYQSELSGLPDLRVVLPREGCVSSHHLFVVCHPRRDDLAQRLFEKRVETGVHYPFCCHQQEAWLAFFPRQSFPMAEALAASCLSLPIFGNITDAEARQVVAAVKEVVPGLQLRAARGEPRTAGETVPHFLR